ncbi:MAG TPA: EcsC family protein [Candidatus Butyricicoccus stercorigallinarum]|nr:EcsC family protein [Candidatus Butyricicoccus stercorigallinarum]
MKRDLWQKEWDDLNRRQARYLRRHGKARERAWDRLQRVVPDGMQDKLDAAFVKAFQLVFEKGTGIIEKTYDKQKRQEDYEIAEYAASVREDRKHVRAFRREAGSRARQNLLLSSVEGIGLGLLGVGLPDIPLFVSVVLKTLYEISLSFGYDYDRMEERLFQLRLIETALYDGPDMQRRDGEMDEMCRSMRGAKRRAPEDTERLTGRLDEQLRRTAKALADDMLYAKFLQGVPVVGAVGGATDVTVLKRISDYAMLKYRRRYLLDREGGEEESASP